MRFAKDEVILHQIKPEPRLLVLWLLNRCLTIGLACAFFPTFTWWFYATTQAIERQQEWEVHSVFFLVAALLGVLATSLAYFYHQQLIRTLTYYITDRRCVWTGGIVRRVEHSVSYYKITDVERSRHLLEQWLKLARINLFTPGTASVRPTFNGRSTVLPELRFEGLSEDESDQIAETINEQVRRFGAIQP